MIGFIVTFSILYTSTPYLKRFKRENEEVENEQEIRAAIKELSPNNSKTTEPHESTSFEKSE